MQDELTFIDKDDISQILPKATGTEINHYQVCCRKLWYFTHGLEMEQESDYVADGKAIHEQCESKQLLIEP